MDGRLHQHACPTHLPTGGCHPPDHPWHLHLRSVLGRVDHWPLWCGTICLFENLSNNTGVFIAFLFPALLQYVSTKRVRDDLSEDVKTPYTTWYSTTPFVIAVFIFGLVALALMLAVLISPNVFGEVPVSACDVRL